MVDNPDEVIEHSLSYCEEYGCTLESIEVEANERRQIFDIPPVTLIVTEHKIQIITCPHCGRMNKAVFPETVKYPVRYGPNILASAIDCKNYQLIPYDRICEFLKTL